MSYSSQVPQRLRTYFGADVTREDFPIIVDAFAQGTGWKSYPIKKKVTVSWCRKMRREGFSKIGVRCNGRTADFSLTEIINGQTKANGFCPICSEKFENIDRHFAYSHKG